MVAVSFKQGLEAQQNQLKNNYGIKPAFLVGRMLWI
jgi:hypothetical protein